MEKQWKETVTEFIFLGFKITADGDCSHETKRCLPLEESYDQPEGKGKLLSRVQLSPWGHKESDMTEQLHFTMGPDAMIFVFEC